MANEDLPAPSADVSDRTRSIVKVAISAAPVIGGPAAELFELVVPSSLERRRQAWFERVADRLRALEDRKVDLSGLADDEGFITVLIEASKAALGTHLEEKLDLLANCVESAALPSDRDDFLAMRLLAYVEELSPEHFVVLTYLASPGNWYDRRGLDRPTGVMGPRRNHLDRAGTGVEGEELTIVLEDLQRLGLANSSGLSGMVSESAQMDPLITERGRLLLDWVQLV
ncbi:MAG: hypothetical protein AB7W59_14255 [Acidimicrobiia bacterium]